MAAEPRSIDIGQRTHSSAIPQYASDGDVSSHPFASTFNSYKMLLTVMRLLPQCRCFELAFACGVAEMMFSLYCCVLQAVVISSLLFVSSPRSACGNPLSYFVTHTHGGTSATCHIFCRRKMCLKRNAAGVIEGMRVSG